MILTQGDTRPVLIFFLKKDGVPVNLAGAASVAFEIEKPSGASESILATIENAAKGQISVQLTAAATDESGQCYAEIVVTWAGGHPQHAERRIPVYVREEYGEAL